LHELGIGVTAYGVLSRGLLTGSALAAKGDLRAHMPRFVGENLERNRKLIDTLNRLAAERGVAPAQLAIAWVLAKDSTIVPVIGARTRRQLEESLAALEIQLTTGEIAHLEETIPASEVAGSRYAETQMRALDSER
jgi:aryl-alcohol dehydrogenase-like predicted oxidoreductase